MFVWVVASLLLNISFGYYILKERAPLFLMQTLTYQGIFLLCLSSWISLLAANFKGLARVEKVVRSTSFSMAIFISLISWVLLIPVDRGGLYTLKNHFFHTLNSAYCIISIRSRPQQWTSSDWKFPLSYGLLYVIYNVYSQFSGERALYPFLDFINNFQLGCVITVISALVIPICHLGLCRLNRLSS